MTESPRCSFILTQGSRAGEPCGWIAKTMTGDGPRCFPHVARDVAHPLEQKRERCSMCGGERDKPRMKSDDAYSRFPCPHPFHEDLTGRRMPLSPPAREEREPCEVHPFSSRACLYGTHGCDLTHVDTEDADELPGERSEPPKPDDVLSRVRVVWEAHRGEPLTSGNYYRLVLDLQAILEPPIETTNQEVE